MSGSIRVPDHFRPGRRGVQILNRRSKFTVSASVKLCVFWKTSLDAGCPSNKHTIQRNRRRTNRTSRSVTRGARRQFAGLVSGHLFSYYRWSKLASSTKTVVIIEHGSFIITLVKSRKVVMSVSGITSIYRVSQGCYLSLI